jgi:hypothetical protein
MNYLRFSGYHLPSHFPSTIGPHSISSSMRDNDVGGGGGGGGGGQAAG